MASLTCVLAAFVPRRGYHLHRSLFYVPADDPKKLSKILTVSADTPVVEMEDGVAINRKAAAREGMKKFFVDNKAFIEKADSGKRVAVRVNSPQTEFFEEDIAASLSVGDSLKTMLIPKVTSLTDVKIILKKISSCPVNKRQTPLGVITYAETADGLINLERICEAMANQSQLINFEGIVFGSDDYVADIGAVRSERSDEVLYARQKVVAVARAFGVQPIDMVYIDIKNREGLRNQAEEGFRYGFSGKQCIHPGQIDIINTAFSPSKQKLKWAVELISEFEKHQQRGSGAFVFQNQMIDMPLLKQARRLVEIDKQISRSETVAVPAPSAQAQQPQQQQARS